MGASIDGTGRLDIVYSILERFPPNQPKARAGKEKCALWQTEQGYSTE